MLVHAVQHGSSVKLRTLLHNMLMQRRATGSVPTTHKELILAVLSEIGSLQYTERCLLALLRDVEDEIRRIERETGKINPKLWVILKKFKIDGS